MNLPSIGASMADAARTREDEQSSICDCCGECPDECGRDERYCMELATEDWGERGFEARRDDRE